MQVITDLPATPDSAIVWRDEQLLLLDQRVLPNTEQFLRLDDAAEVADAIRDMVVRGAPAIGITAAFGVVVSARARFAEQGAGWKQAMQPDLDRLEASRPTAVNLFWALRRMQRLVETLADDVDPYPVLLAEAQAIHEEDIAANRRMGQLGAGLIEAETQVITHCNAGALATGGYGTALGVIRAAYEAGKIGMVLADETRPWMQGSRLTAWELHRDGIPVTLQTEGAAASRMAAGGVGWVVVGSDRIAANGDVANKIGTYNLAVAARYHGVKFMVAAPTSTVDMAVASGADIPIEQRDPNEILACGGSRLGAPGVDAWNPVFDVTPAALVDAIVTEKGVVEQPNREKMAEMMAS